MKTQAQYIAERRKLAADLERLNNAMCADLANLLRKNDEYQRVQRELGEKPASLIPEAYLDSCYRILSFGQLGDRLVLMTGTSDEIETLVSKVQRQRGFYTSTGFWIEL